MKHLIASSKQWIWVVVTSLTLSTAYSGTPAIHDEHIGTIHRPIPFAFSIAAGPNALLNPWKDRVVNFHLSIFAGQVGGVQGLQLGAIYNQVQGDFVGYDATGIYSHITGNFAGFQAGGLINRVDGHYVGMQNAGIMNRIGDGYFGMQSAGILNQVSGNFIGLQVGGIRNETEDVKGVQIAGISNEAEDVEGVQISGLINEAGRVRGVQIGVINRSKKLDGIALGLINLSQSGKVHLISWGSSESDYQVGVKFAPNDYWYTILTMGQLQDPFGSSQLTSFESHLGFHLPLMAKFFTEIDLGTGNTAPRTLVDWDSDEYHQMVEARIALGLRITPRLSLVGGVSSRRTYDGHDFWDHGKDEVKPFLGIQL